MPIMPARPPLRPSAPAPLALFDWPIVLWKPDEPPLRPPLLLLLELLPKPEPLELPPRPDWPLLLLPPSDRRSAADCGAVDPGVSNEVPLPPTKMSLSTLATCFASL